MQTTLSKIAEQQKECQSDVANVGSLPGISEILKQIENYGTSEDIKKQERIITEALADLTIRRRLPPNDPDITLYPDESTLQAMVANARVELIRLRAYQVTDDGKANREKYLSGVNQLDKLAAELSNLASKDSPCYKKEPLLRQQVLAGLVGIAGFFARSPAGIGVTMAGRIFQRVIDLGDSRSNGRTLNFDASHQVLLAAGLACSLENLSEQHCRLVRQESLIEKLSSGVCAQSKCSDEMKQYLALQEKGQHATQAIDAINSNLASKANASSDQSESSSINSEFLSATSKFESGINEAREISRKIETSSLPESKRNNLYRSIQIAVSKFSTEIFGTSLLDTMTNIQDRPINTLFDKEARQNHALLFLFDDTEIRNLIETTTREFNSSQELRARFSVVGSEGGTKTISQGVYTNLLFRATTEYSFMSSTKTTGEAQVRDRMVDPIVFDRINARLAQIKSKILQRTAIKPKQEEVADFASAFFQEDLGKPGTLRSLEDVRDFFKSLPPDFRSSFGNIMDLKTIETEVNELANLGERVELQQTELTIEAADQLMAKTRSFLDPSRGMKDRIAKIAAAASSHQVRKISRHARSPNEINDLIFLQNRDFLEWVYDIKNPYQRDVDIQTALALSASQIDGFGSFFNSYLEPALNVLNKNSAEGGKFNAGLSENIDQRMKDHFCIQALGLTEMPKAIYIQCENARIRMGNSELKFSDFQNKPHKDRVCAYRNFLNRVDIKKSTRPSPANTENKGTDKVQ